MLNKRFVARPSRTSRPSTGNGGGVQTFAISYDNGSPSESWIGLPSFQRPRPLFLIKSPDGIAPVEKIATDLNAGADFLSFPSLGRGTVPLEDCHPSNLGRGEFSLACLGTDRRMRRLEFADDFGDTPTLLDQALKSSGRFSICIVANHPSAKSDVLCRPAFVFRTLPYRTNPECLESMLSTVIRLRNHLNSSSASEALRIPFFFVDHIASKLDCIKILESLSRESNG